MKRRELLHSEAVPRRQIDGTITTRQGPFTSKTREECPGRPLSNLKQPRRFHGRCCRADDRSWTVLIGEVPLMGIPSGFLVVCFNTDLAVFIFVDNHHTPPVTPTPMRVAEFLEYGSHVTIVRFLVWGEGGGCGDSGFQHLKGTVSYSSIPE